MSAQDALKQARVTMMVACVVIGVVALGAVAMGAISASGAVGRFFSKDAPVAVIVLGGLLFFTATLGFEGVHYRRRDVVTAISAA